jgi:predicted nucleotidyltransferase
MKTIFKPSIWKILRLFYENKNTPMHLREISRKTNLNESTISTHLNNLLKDNILKAESEANLKKFYVNKVLIPEIFPLFDSEKLESLSILRRDAIKLYVKKLEKKPLLILVFGSTAKGTYKNDSDIDILEVSYKNNKEEKIKSYVEAQTGIKIQVFKMTEIMFNKELNSKKDKVIQTALETGFPVFNAKYFYEVIYNE